jgi:hypothetical protein
VWLVAIAAIALGEPRTLIAAVAGAQHTLTGLAFFGLPLAYLGMLLVGVPLYRVLEDRGWLRLGPMLASATGGGALILGSVALAFAPNGSGLDLAAAAGGAGGFGVGLAAWWIAVREPRRRVA